MIVQGWANEGGQEGKKYKKHGSLAVAYVQGLLRMLRKADKT